MNIVRDVLDNQLVDRQGYRMGRVNMALLWNCVVENRQDLQLNITDPEKPKLLCNLNELQ